jgi:hypothetical protein
MTERDELWVPETWEKEDEGKMCKRLKRGLGEVMDRSGGCTCTSIFILFLLLLLVVSQSLLPSSSQPQYSILNTSW